MATDSLDSHRRSFQQLSSFLQAIKDTNPDTYTHLALSNNRFHRLFICPVTSRTSFAFCRKFIAVDGTFLKGRFIQTLLLATTIDANNNILLLAWGIVESENVESWSYFLNHLMLAIPEILIQHPPTTLMTDRDKGLSAAIATYGSQVVPTYCCFHLKENFTTKHGRGLADNFWRIARAIDHHTFTFELQQLQQHNQAAATYLAEIPKELWVTAYFPGRRYNQDTSNIVERVNAEFKSDRELSIIGLLSSLWHKTMTTRYSRQQQADKHQGDFTPWTLQQVQKLQITARMHQVEMSSILEGRVTEGRQQLALQHFVDLHHHTCTCRVYQDLGLPCHHALACILHIHRNPLLYIPDDLSLHTWRQTYLTNMRPVVYTLATGTIDAEIEAPLTRVPRGRPRKERHRRDTRGQRAPQKMEGQVTEQKCSTCQRIGHNARTCRNPHM